MKIENTKLMIGDWVKINTHLLGDEIRYDKVIEIGKHIDYGIPTNFIRTNTYRGLEAFEPIPLTEELLNNNGGSYNRIDTEKHTIYYRYSAEGGVFIELIEDGDEMTPSRTIFAKELDYVHQYQHLLRLCGLDELADNFEVD